MLKVSYAWVTIQLVRTTGSSANLDRIEPEKAPIRLVLTLNAL